MIQANELRIGNLLNYDTAEGDVVTATIDWQDLKWATEDPKGFNLVHTPIPVTEEWLIKFGFNKIRDLNNSYVFPSKEFKYNIIGNDKGGWFMMFFNTTKIEYVHQLQNLYFALTGQELEIKN